ncbi:MAG: hypothetical protein KGJ40_04685 [candidate division NC10 bacterium]|nr:hypothetical protein [candidate division NC10 bacterium]MDE2484550.1 hypothetical protein [candidate division NC10 bacterium]
MTVEELSREGERHLPKQRHNPMKPVDRLEVGCLGLSQGGAAPDTQIIRHAIGAA